jgi:hypothetical protein
MKTLGCPEVEALIDLYAAHECDSTDSKAVRAHLTACAACQHKLDESRRLLTLLDIHHRADDALARLHQRIEAEARPQSRPVILRFRSGVQRFAAVAALLLVTFGLWLGLGPIASPPAGQYADSTFGLESKLVVLASRSAAAVPAHVGVMKVTPPPTQKRTETAPAVKSTLEVVHPDLAGKSLIAWKHDIEAGQKTGHLPLSPQIPLEVNLHNPGPRTLVVAFAPDDPHDEGLALGWRLDVHGPGVLRSPVTDRPTPRPAAVKVPPGGTKAFKLERLEETLSGRLNFVYLTVPGDYLLKVTLRVLAWPAGHYEQRRVITLLAGPVILRVEDVR